MYPSVSFATELPPFSILEIILILISNEIDLSKLNEMKT